MERTLNILGFRKRCEAQKIKTKIVNHGPLADLARPETFSMNKRIGHRTRVHLSSSVQRKIFEETFNFEYLYF